MASGSIPLTTTSNIPAGCAIDARIDWSANTQTDGTTAWSNWTCKVVINFTKFGIQANGDFSFNKDGLPIHAGRVNPNTAWGSSKNVQVWSGTFTLDHYANGLGSVLLSCSMSFNLVDSVSGAYYRISIYGDRRVEPDPAILTRGKFHRWNGSGWNRKFLQRIDGQSYSHNKVLRWNGSSWIEIP